MPLVHIVLFEFKPNTEGAVIHDVCQISIQHGERGARWWGHIQKFKDRDINTSKPKTLFARNKY